MFLQPGKSRRRKTATSTKASHVPEGSIKQSGDGPDGDDVVTEYVSSDHSYNEVSDSETLKKRIVELERKNESLQKEVQNANLREKRAKTICKNLIEEHKEKSFLTSELEMRLSSYAEEPSTAILTHDENDIDLRSAVSARSWRSRYLMDYDPVNQLLVCMMCGEQQYSYSPEGARAHIEEAHPETLSLGQQQRQRLQEAWDQQVAQREQFLTSQLQQHAMPHTEPDPEKTASSSASTDKREREPTPPTTPSTAIPKHGKNDIDPISAVSDSSWPRRYLMDYDLVNQLLVCMVCGEQQFSYSREGARAHIEEAHPETLSLGQQQRQRLQEAWDQQVAQREQVLTSQLQQHAMPHTEETAEVEVCLEMDDPSESIQKDFPKAKKQKMF
ncbi:hypothetical protein ACEWY4_025065 [Coilia grayii]|uniref:SPIN-DOC-like zinc-finger domain-containing protein n=1 Tax=Coilia grayii TaxID=363190 RepID=A0ABD1IYA6_9TELE